MSTIQCKHVDLKKNQGRSIYIYDIGDKQKLWLCPDCNMNLAGEIARQQAIEVFLHNPVLCSCKVCVDEEKRVDEEMFQKLNSKEVKKNVRKGERESKQRKTRRGRTKRQRGRR